MRPELEDWLTAKEAADMLGIHRNSVLDAARAGRLPSRKMGNMVLVQRAAVEGYVVRRFKTDEEQPEEQATE